MQLREREILEQAVRTLAKQAVNADELVDEATAAGGGDHPVMVHAKILRLELLKAELERELETSVAELHEVRSRRALGLGLAPDPRRGFMTFPINSTSVMTPACERVCHVMQRVAREGLISYGGVFSCRKIASTARSAERARLASATNLARHSLVAMGPGLDGDRFCGSGPALPKPRVAGSIPAEGTLTRIVDSAVPRSRSAIDENRANAAALGSVASLGSSPTAFRSWSGYGHAVLSLSTPAEGTKPAPTDPGDPLGHL